MLPSVTPSTLNPSAPFKKKHAWPQIKAALAEFHFRLPREFSFCVLIGGPSALAYRAALESAQLSRFLPQFPENESFHWLSSDADFVNPYAGSQEIALLCPPDWLQQYARGHKYLETHGVRLSFFTDGSDF
jgi:hypothetical protein